MTDREKSHWVMQTIKGVTIAHGPYRSEEARDNRYEKISGGEISTFSNWSSNKEEAIQEFQSERVG